MNKSNQTTGFTLVELLLVMAIIAVLASLSLAIVNDAQYDAKANATRSRISTVQSILRQKLETYTRRRLSIDIGDPALGLDRRKQREYRKRIISDIVNVEMPRRAQNIAFQTDSVTLSTSRSSIYPSQEFLEGVRNDDDLNSAQQNSLVDLLVDADSTAFASRFKRSSDPDSDGTGRYPETGASYSVNDVTFDLSDPDTYPSTSARTTVSEYLYAILGTCNFDGISAIEALGEGSFADTDQDGFLEFVDSWGDPICFQFEVDTDDDGEADMFGLDPGNSETGIAIRNLSIRLFSTGNDIETITN